MKTLSERNRILNEVKDSCYLAFFDGNPEEGGKEILTGRKKVNFPVATNGYVKSTNQLDFTGGEEATIEYGGTSQKQYEGYNMLPNNLQTQELNGVKFTKNNDGSITIKGTATARTEPRLWSVGDGGSVVFSAGQTYRNTTDRVLYFYAGGYNSLGPKNNLTPGSTMTCSYVYIRVENGETIDTTIYPQIILGNSDKDFEPYVGGIPAPNPDYPQDVQNITIENVELCKIGDYQDYLYTENGKWYKHAEIGKIVFDGSTNWLKHSTTGGNVFMLSSTGFVGYGYGSHTKAPALMDTDYVGALGEFSDNAYGKFGISNTSQLRIFRGNYDSSYTADLFKSEMIGHYMYGALLTPTDTEITDQATISALEEMFGSATGVAKYWGVYDSEIGGKLLYYYILPYEVRIVKDSTITIKAGNCILKEG